MAEIKIEKKEANVWPWVIGLVILAALVWFFLTQRNAADDQVLVDTTATVDSMAAGDMAASAAIAGAPQPVNNYFVWVEENEARMDMGLDHEFTSSGIIALVGALEATIERDSLLGSAVEPQLEDARQRANALRDEPEPTNHANLTREAFISTAALMRAMQQRSFPALADQVEEVHDAAESIDGDELLLDQKEDVKEFFEHAAISLRGMTTATV
ncbi:MAG: hypothetical protein ACRENI_11520 [Gemmatimonadaceae bacterium]